MSDDASKEPATEPGVSEGEAKEATPAEPAPAAQAAPAATPAAPIDELSGDWPKQRDSAATAAAMISLPDFEDASLPPPPERRGLGIALVVVALCGLAFAAQSRAWLANIGYSQEVGFGLIDDYACDNRGECESLGNDELVARYDALVDAPRRLPEGSDLYADPPAMSPWDSALPRTGFLDHASSAFVPAGYAALGLLGFAALALVLSGVIAASGRRPQLPMSPCSLAVIVLGLDLLCGLVFVATKPGPTTMVGVGTAFWVFGGGVLIGTAGALLLARCIRPLDHDVLTDESLAPDPEPEE